MKKYYLSLLLSGFSYLAIAQHRDEAKAFEILDHIGQHSFQATFVYSSRASQDEPREACEGKITAQGNQYHLNLPGQEIVSDGETVWTHLTEAKEVQITDYDPEQAATPWRIFADYRQAYALARLGTEQIDGQACDVVELVAKDDEYDLLKVVLTVAHTTRHIKRLEILDSNQTAHIFSFTDFVYSLEFDKGFFSFSVEAHQGIEIIDMR